MSTVIQLSDLHVSRRKAAAENRRLQRIVGWLRKRYAANRPHVILSGDITNNGSEVEYHNAVEILAPLRDDGFPLVTCPGNHDVGPAGNSFSIAARVYFQQYMLGKLMGIDAATTASHVLDEYYPMVTQLDDAVLIGLDSAHQEDHLASGRVGAKQRAALCAELAQVPAGKRTLIYVHHHPFVHGRAMRMIDGKELLDDLAGKVDVLCFGHKHKWKTWVNEHNIPIVGASGKTTKRVPHKGFRFFEFKVGGGAPSVAKRYAPFR